MKRIISMFLVGVTLFSSVAALSSCNFNKEEEQPAEDLPEETLTEKIERMYAEGIDSAEEADLLRALVWQEYVEGVKADEPGREKELQKNKITKIKLGRITMKVETKVVGRKAPEGGYPVFIVMHGGGYDPSGQTNESQWAGMAGRYVQTGVEGIYVSVRSVSDNESSGQIFSTDISWQFYDRIIDNAILFMEANPNKVYVVGYSAGGNGVYQVAPAMADYLASATMTAGHPEGIDLSSLYNVPFYLQVGELDGAYSRNIVTVEYANKLEALNRKYGGGYGYECFVHAGKEHGVVGDNATSKQSVIKDYNAWYDAQLNGKPYNGGTVSATTDAATLMTQHTRDPYPENIVWNLATSRIKARDNNTFYWLSAEGVDTTVVAKLDKSTNTITVGKCNRKAISSITIYLNEDMLDIFSQVTVVYDDSVKIYTPEISLDLLRQTTEERCDPNYQFCASITIKI